MLQEEIIQQMNRRHFLSKMSMGIGTMALGSLLGCSKESTLISNDTNFDPLDGNFKFFAFCCQSKKGYLLIPKWRTISVGTLFDYKPLLNERQGEDLPASVRMGQRLTGMTAYQATKPMAGSIYEFKQHGQSGSLGK